MSIYDTSEAFSDADQSMGSDDDYDFVAPYLYLWYTLLDVIQNNTDALCHLLHTHEAAGENFESTSEPFMYTCPY